MAAPSPQRARLRELIDQLRSLEAERDRLASASRPAWEAEIAARTAVETARANVDAVAKQGVEHRISALAGVDDEAPPSVLVARQAVLEAEAELTAARLAHDEIERRTEANARAIDASQSMVRIEARSVAWSEMQPAVRTLVAEAKRLQQQFLSVMAPLIALYNAAPSPFPDDAIAQALRDAVNDFYRYPSGWSCAQPLPPHAPEAVSEFLAALQVDAAAKLPR